MLDPVIENVLAWGGLKADLLKDVAVDARPTARAINGLLRSDGRTWRELAECYATQQNEGPVTVLDELPGTWLLDEQRYYTINEFIELFHWGLEYSFPEIRDEHYSEEDEMALPKGSSGVIAVVDVLRRLREPGMVYVGVPMTPNDVIYVQAVKTDLESHLKALMSHAGPTAEVMAFEKDGELYIG